MSKIKGTIIVDKERCKGCSLCVVACPMNVLSLCVKVNAKGYNYSMMSNEEDCTGCTSCAQVCPDSCITVYRKKMD